MYPISYEADFNPEPNRWTTFFRLILAIPWFVVALFWGLLFVFTHFIAWIAIVILGRYPQWLYDFNSGVVRFGLRTGSWLYLLTDAWPPFGLSDDSSYPVRINVPPPAASQSRLKALFRLVLALPVLVLVSYVTNFAAQTIAFGAWLTIVFRGYMPEWIFTALVECRRFETRVFGYAAFLTDDYPPIGLERAKPAPPAAAPAPESPPPAAA
ncbi:MAG TPA: DUF4389 domain-containing protein [Solirubrobacterales bacterium]|jgi:hypothetical protein|nr:DUF4389 domain-containing protein [Solirubrobacterales bacterium]